MIDKFNISQINEVGDIVFVLPCWPFFGLTAGTTNEGKG